MTSPSGGSVIPAVIGSILPIIILLVVLGVSIYLISLIIKALKVYIKKNS